MTRASIKTRFAPSPTGYVHIGNARTALFNVLLARANDGPFLLRIEDTDRERSRDLYVQALKEDLRWLGLDWQEGPEVGGAHAPYAQSRREPVYRQYFEDLDGLGLAYPCFCTPQELAMSRKAQRAMGQPPRYAGTCAHLGPQEVEARLAEGRRPSLRFRVARDRVVTFQDLARGAQRFATNDIGDFIIRRADGSPAFFFSNAVDDALMGVSHVLRGEDHLTNTPRQILLLEALGLPIPAYGHISLILGTDGAPLSKRNGSRSLRDLRAGGYLPEAVNNYLARLGHKYVSDEFMDLAALAADFDLARLGRAPARYDERQLRHWQSEAIMRAFDERLWDWMRAYAPIEESGIEQIVPPVLALEFVRVVRDNVEMPSDAALWARRLFAEGEPVSAGAQEAICGAGKVFFESALELLDPGAQEFKPYAQALGKSLGRKGKNLFMPLRAALTGETHGPEMARVFSLLGGERVRHRLADALARCEQPYVQPEL